MLRKEEKIMDENLVVKASKLYGIAKEECNFIGGFQNSVYSYAKDNKNYVLRFTHDSHRSDTLIRAELDWVKLPSRQRIIRL